MVYDLACQMRGSNRSRAWWIVGRLLIGPCSKTSNVFARKWRGRKEYASRRGIGSLAEGRRSDRRPGDHDAYCSLYPVTLFFCDFKQHHVTFRTTGTVLRISLN